MFASSTVDTLWAVGTIVVVGFLFWLSRRIEPHWVAKDGRSFTCRIQPIRPDGRVEGRWRDARATVDGRELRVVLRGLGNLGTRPAERHHVIGRSATPPRRRAVFVLDGEPMWALRIPASSRAVAVLDELVPTAP